MIARKEKQYLVFEFDDGKDVRFDLSTGQFIGKKGKPVKGLTGQLSGYTIQEVIDSFSDEKYRKFLSYVYDVTIEKSWGWTSYSNVGTFLNHVKEYLNLEQFFACGFTNIDLRSKTLKLSDVPKQLLKICREKDLKLTDTFLLAYNQNATTYLNLLKENYNMFNVYNMMDYYGGRRTRLDYFNELIKTYNYKPQSLARYIDNIMMYEGESNQSNVIQLLYDYASMMSAISHKFEKYPRYLSTIHNIAARNYTRLKKDFPEKLFSNRVNEVMEYTYKEIAFIYPKTTQDIKDEAVGQSNCVASYIDNVIKGECDIIFMRNKQTPNKSYITLEVRSGKVVQSRGKFNRECTDEEKMIINKYEEYLYKISNKKEKVA